MLQGHTQLPKPEDKTVWAKWQAGWELRRDQILTMNATLGDFRDFRTEVKNVEVMCVCM